MSASIRWHVSFWGSIVLSGVWAKGPHTSESDFVLAGIWLGMAFIFLALALLAQAKEAR